MREYLADTESSGAIRSGELDESGDPIAEGDGAPVDALRLTADERSQVANLVTLALLLRDSVR